MLTVACVEDQYEGLKNQEVTAEDGCRPCPSCLVCDGDERKVRHMKRAQCTNTRACNKSVRVPALPSHLLPLLALPRVEPIS